MSILDLENKSPSRRAAAQIVRSTSRLADHLVREWETNFDLIWGSSDPAAVLEELGTDAQEVFALSVANVQFLASILQGKRQDDLNRILAKVASLPKTTTHPDGRITVKETDEK